MTHHHPPVMLLLLHLLQSDTVDGTPCIHLLSWALVLPLSLSRAHVLSLSHPPLVNKDSTIRSTVQRCFASLPAPAVHCFPSSWPVLFRDAVLPVCASRLPYPLRPISTDTLGPWMLSCFTANPAPPALVQGHSYAAPAGFNGVYGLAGR